MMQEVAWLIERDKSKAYEPEYVGMDPNKPGINFWTFTAYRARRFRNYDQARQFAEKAFGEVHAHRICEHVFG